MYFTSMYPWSWAEGPSRAAFSPRSSSTSSQEADSLEGEPSGVIRVDHNKRGRPRAEKISSLILEGALSSNSIRCRICSRVFPREKSLQAHMRTHTGERPYVCDFPGCVKSFCQSGQLKTHQRLHTGEKPFACSIEGCPSRFTHANRHCTEHPYASLRRISTQEQLKDRMIMLKSSANQSVTEWLTRHCIQRDDQAVAPTQPEKKLKRESTLPPATPVVTSVQLHRIDVTPCVDSTEIPMPLLTPRSPASIASSLSGSSISSACSFNSTPSSQPSSPTTSTSFPSIVSVTSQPCSVSASCNFSSSAMTTDKSTPTSLPTSLPTTRALSSSVSLGPTRTVGKPSSGPRPFKKEATDKWVSALALLELAQGVA